ncbi:MAG: prepilin-type N-terminal cleavage/methylation domain-containing protein [Deltaproteobacteria bacterium]|jgi:general secretion pathway protein G|nr:prepilin-type N-terminal cleavage/methylation domain-containing protein [Deltaproteobacteria bacterium]
MIEGKDKHFSFNHSNFHQNSSFVEKYPHGYYGFTLLETMIVVAIIGILAAIATPTLFTYRTKAKIALAIAEIRIMEQEINVYLMKWDRLPDSLTEIKLGNIEDPWGNPYQYLKLDGEVDDEKGKPRKDHFMVPVNSDFDLYSMGKDGQSLAPFTAKASRDDIVRANDGKYVGLASEY